MKNKKILLAIFLVVVLMQIVIGVRSTLGGIDILKTGKIVKLEIDSVRDVGAHEYRNFEITKFSEFSLPYKGDIDFVDKEIKKTRNKKKYYVPLAEYKQEFYLIFKEGVDGVYREESYSKTLDNPDVYVKERISGCRLFKYENKKEVPLNPPELCFDSIRLKLSYSKNQLKKIAGYVNKIPRDKRETVGVFRYKDGIFLPVDMIVNGKSLNEIAGKKEF